MKTSLVVAGFIVLLSAREEIVDPIGLDGVLDERVSYVPLGHSHIFNCEASRKISYLARSLPVWYVIFYDWDSKEMKRIEVKSIRKTANERFRQLDDYSLLAAGLQRWHDGVVVECVVSTSDTTAVISRHRIVIQDCGSEEEVMNKRDPCVYGFCDVHGFRNLYEIVRCNCTADYTGDFCTVRVDGVLRRELIFFSPIIFMLIVIVLLYVFSDTIEFVGQKKRMRLEKHLPKYNRLLDGKTLYPSVFINQELVDRVLHSAWMEGSPIEMPSKQEYSSKEKPSKEQPSKKAIQKNDESTRKSRDKTSQETMSRDKLSHEKKSSLKEGATPKSDL